MRDLVSRVEAEGVDWNRFRQAKKIAFKGQHFVPNYKVVGDVINRWVDSVLGEDSKAA